MKTKYIIAAASALLLLAGCAREMDFQTPGSSVLRAVIESNETRVSFDTQLGKFSWDAGDQIAVYVGDAFEDVDIIDPQTGAFLITGTGDRSFYAVYPASAAPADNTALTVTLPDSYTVNTADADFSPVPMVAQNIQGQDELYFLHVGGLVRIFVEIDDEHDAATTAVVSFDKDVTGTYTVNTSNTANPTITTAGTASNNTVTFTLPTASKSFVLNVPVPCGTYETVKVAINNENPVQINASALTFARHHGKVMEFGEVHFTYGLEGLHDVTAEYLGGTKELAQTFESYKTADGGITKVAVPFEFEFCQDPEGTDPETGDPYPWTLTPPAWFSVADGVDYTGSTSGLPLHLVITPQVNTAVDRHAQILQERTPKTDFDLSTINVATGETVARTTANCYVVDAPGSYKFPLVYGNGVQGGIPTETAWHATDGVGGPFREVDYTNGELQELVAPNFATGRGLLAYFVDHLDRPITSPYITTHLAGYELSVEIIGMDVVRNNGGGTLNGRLLIRNAALTGEGEDTYITFDVPAESIEQGNALIALKAKGPEDTEAKVAWSWHIWVTDDDLTAVEGPNDYWFAPQELGWHDSRETSRFDERTWYIRVKQTEDGGTVSDPLKVTSLAGKILIESGGKATSYQKGRKDPAMGTYLETQGTGEPKPHAANFYYNPGVSYITSVSNVPELKKGSGTDPANWPNPWLYPTEYGDYGMQNGYVSWDDPMTPNTTESITLVRNNTIGLSIRYPRTTFTPSRSSSWTNRAWHNLWDSSDNVTTNKNETLVPSTKTIYDPSPVGYKVPPLVAFLGFNTDNTTFATYEGRNGRQYDNGKPEKNILFIPFGVSTSNSVQWARLATSRQSSSTSQTIYTFMSDYVYGQQDEPNYSRFAVLPVTD